MSDTPEHATPARKTPTSTPMLRKTLTWTALAAVALVVLSAGIGFLVAGTNGLWSGLVGVGLAVIFLALTPLSMLIANRWFGTEMFVPLFFGIVMGGWLLKFVLFFVAMVILREQAWVVPTVTFLSLVAGIAVSLAIDAVAFTKIRMPYASDVALPQINPEERDDS
ncbi:hypothetical protein DC31_04700 [Microbacterium sp. CH12i]|uniref:hypothetical protein n=1 Tax=Microbacterium sp. CH12i TaxID=1479651 RepID=UPI0004613967|nr:hypothetical protein [Microbacterium sp. CH12i]KDA04826.1 hypothetical protein DC31_04700 [Microbacterium sp. CH12i]